MCRKILPVVVLFALILVVRATNVAQAAERLDVDTIKMALQVTDEEDNGFIGRVVTLMDEGRISRKIVTMAFIKARKRVKHKFEYFKFAMIRLAKQEGVNLT